MGTYNLPRNVKGEGRILFIFSTKALIYTAIGVVVGLIFYSIFSILNFTIGGLIAIGIFGLIGFIIGTFKMPESTAFEITRKTGGENIDEVIKRYFKFKTKKNKIYTYFKGGNANGQQKLD
mgnify:CR=1 FL=1